MESLSARGPTPGGGSASACIASMAAALGTMVSLGKEGRGWASGPFMTVASLGTVIKVMKIYH